MLRTLRSRLAALATVTTLAVSALVCLALYLGIRYSLYREIDAFLAGEVMEFRAMIAAAQGDLDDVERRIRAEVGSRKRGDLTFRLLDETGRVRLTSEPGSSRLPDPWAVPARMVPELYFRTEAGPTAHAQTRTCSQWIRAPDGAPCILQTTYLLDQVHSSLNYFQRICGGALVCAAGLAALGGHVLATRSLRPVGKMVVAARGIGLDSLRKRLERSGLSDEMDLLAETFNTMFDRLEQQVAQLRQFTADAAHELRSPLAALRGSAELALAAERTPDQLRDVLADSIDEYDRLARIADDLLLLARADAGQALVRREPLRMDVAVADVVDLYAPLAAERSLDLDLSKSAELVVDGDDGRLRQVVANLLDNAVKYTPAGGRITVTLTPEGRKVELLIRDTGVGIPEGELPRVFDRFYRLDRSRAREAGGAGLGLAICRTIIEAHGGTISLESSAQRGTTVRVQLPLLNVNPNGSESSAGT